MNFSKFDMVILVVMSVGIVVMSFVFPALGLAETETSEDAIPEFQMDSDRFDFAGDFPDQPGTPSQGTLQFDTSEQAEFSDNQRWLDGNTQNGTEINLVQATPASDPSVAEVNLFNWDGGNVVDEDNATFNQTGEQAIVEAGNYEVALEFVTQESLGGDDYLFEVDYSVEEQPESGGGWLDRIPVVGGLFDAASSLAGVLSWIGSVFWWFVVSTWELAFNVIGMMVDITTFVFDTASWLASTYGAILSAADAWVAVFVAIPGLLLSLEFAKLVMIAISLLPFT